MMHLEIQSKLWMSTCLPLNTFRCPVLVLCTVSDLRAIAKWNQQKSTPAIKGACTSCAQEGKRINSQNISVYIGAAAFLDQDNAFRKKFETFLQEQKRKLPRYKTHET